MGVMATGWQSFRDVELADLGTLMIVDFLKHAWTTD